MNYRSLLVLLDPSAACAARLQLAMRLARERDCHLVGLAPTGLLDVPPDSGAASSLADYAARALDAVREQAERAAQNFRDECHAAGVKSFESVSDEADKAESLVRHAHCSDLVVLTQAAPKADDRRSAQALVEEVVLHGAPPTRAAARAAPPRRWGPGTTPARRPAHSATRCRSCAMRARCSWCAGHRSARSATPRCRRAWTRCSTG